MAKMTVLAMVQSILNDMDSDEVNSISDTVEAAQVASILEDTFYEITNDRKWPTHKKLSTLTATDENTPTHMRIPTTSDVTSIEWIKYDVNEDASRKEYKTMKYMEPDEFMLKLMSRDSSSSTIDTVTNIGDGVDLLIVNNKAPQYYTSFDDDYVVFDSYDSDIDTDFLVGSKTIMYALIEPTFTKSDSAVPDIPSKAFPYFLAEAKSTCFASLKQSASAKEEQKSKRQRSWLAREKKRINGGTRYPDYGRQGKKG